MITLAQAASDRTANASSRHVEFVFQLDKAETEWGESLLVVGDCQELGSWVPEEAVPIFTDAASYPKWQSSKVLLDGLDGSNIKAGKLVSLNSDRPEDRDADRAESTLRAADGLGTLVPDTHVTVTYKYVRDRRRLGQGFVWESNINRQVSIPWGSKIESEAGTVWVVSDAAFDAPGIACVTDAQSCTLSHFRAQARHNPRYAPERTSDPPPETTPEPQSTLPLRAVNAAVAFPPLLENEEKMALLGGCVQGFDASYRMCGDAPVAKGGFSTVWRCRRRQAPEEEDHDQRAVKRIFTDKMPQRDRRLLFGSSTSSSNQSGELALHAILPEHPNIVKLFETFVEQDPGVVSLVMRLCQGGDLLDLVLEHQRTQGRGLSETAAANVARQLFAALVFLHSHHVLHRDVKAENILQLEARKDASIERATFCLGDFGLATRVRTDEVVMCKVGSPSTVAPEVLAGRPYGQPADLWSAGAVLFTALAARRPRADGSTNSMKAVELVGKPWDESSEDLKDLLGALLQLDGARRPSAAEAKVHKWVTGTRC